MPEEDFPVQIVVDEGANTDDIQKFVITRVDRAISEKRLLRGRVTSDLRQTIIRKLNEGAQGMFLWVRLQLDGLCTEGIKLERDVLAELDKAPKGIGQFYERELARIMQYGESSREVATSVLRWSLVSRRPLPIGALLEAVSQPEERTITRDEVLDVCRGLIVADDETETFRFAHLSIQEFLQEKAEYTQDALHTFAALRCLEEFESPRQDLYDEKNQPNPNSECFYAYAVVYLMSHIGMIRERDVTLSAGIGAFLVNEDAFAAWNRDSLESKERQDSDRSIDEFGEPCLNGRKPSPSLIIARFGLLEMVDEQSTDTDWRYPSTSGDSPIHVSSHYGHLEIVQWLVEEKDINVNSCAYMGYTPLMSASASGNNHIVEYLLSHDGVEINGRSMSGGTALIAACRAGNLKTCRQLLKAGADVNLQDSEGDTSLIAAAISDKPEIVEILLKKHTVSPDTHGRRGRTALLAVVERGGKSAMKTLKLLIQAKADLNARDDAGDTALHKASRAGSFDMVKLLVDKKATIDVPNVLQETALDHALTGNKVDIIHYLLDHGATCQPDASGNTELHEAITGGCDESIIKLLISKGVDVNAKDDEERNLLLTRKAALHRAAEAAQHATLKVLLEANADITAEDFYFRRTPFHKAILNECDPEIIELFISRGADVNGRDNEGYSALHLAARNSEYEIMRLLLDADADYNALDSNLRTPLHEAISFYCDIGVVELIVNRGANVNLMSPRDSVVPVWIVLTLEAVLHHAVERGGLAIVQLLVDAGARVAADTSSGESLLHLAVRGCSFEVLQHLLSNDADDLKLEAKNDLGMTALAVACSMVGGADNIVHLLLKAGADPYTTDNDCWSPLHHATKVNRTTAVKMLLDAVKVDLAVQTASGSRTVLDLAVENGNLELVEKFLDRGVKPHLDVTHNLSPLHWLSSACNTHTIVKRLLAAGYSANALDLAGRTPLHTYLETQAADEGVVRLLLSEGADPNIRDNGGNNALDCLATCSQASQAVLRLLINQKVDFDEGDSDGLRALHKFARLGLAPHAHILLEAGADIHAKDKDNRQAIQYAVKANEAVVSVLLDFNADVNVVDSDWPTPLLIAAAHANLDVLRLLLDSGADANAEGPEGHVALHAVCERDESDYAFVKLLLSYGAEVNAMAWNTKNTPLHLAAANETSNMASIIELLMSKGAIVDARNSEGKTPLICACENKCRSQVVHCFMKAGADPMIKDNDGITALHYSGFKNDQDLTSILMSSPRCTDIDVQDSNQWTPLMEASWNGQVSAVKALLKAGCNAMYSTREGLNACICAVQGDESEVVKLLLAHNSDIATLVDKDNETALHIACRQNQIEMVKLLLEARPSALKVENSAGYTPLHVAACRDQTEMIALILTYDEVDSHHKTRRGCTPLQEAAAHGAQEAVKLLMAVEGTDLRAKTVGGRTLFTLSAAKGLASVCETLIKQDVADYKSPDTMGGYCALHDAAESNDASTVELILGQPGVDKNVLTDNRCTPLWLAVNRGSGTSVEILLAHGVDPDAPDHRGRTPLFMAVLESNQEIVEMLLNAGVKMQLDEALEMALAQRDADIVQLLRDSGAIEHNMGIEELMGGAV
ncbi:hypothetical protein E4T39_04622 [Aureobasidium subglaciale]|nr:hypothetical protein E4T39_04622 [Aureobasidium subglaciale]